MTPIINAGESRRLAHELTHRHCGELSLMKHRSDARQRQNRGASIGHVRRLYAIGIGERVVQQHNRAATQTRGEALANRVCILRAAVERAVGPMRSANSMTRFYLATALAPSLAVGKAQPKQRLAEQIFQLEMTPAPWLPLLAAPGGALLAVAVGWWAMRRLLAVPPLAVLRSGA